MYRLKDFVLLRNWTLGRDADVSLEDVRAAFDEMIEGIGGNIGIRDIEIDGKLPGFALYSYTNSSYMSFYVYTYQERRETFIELAAEGKGEQAKASDLEKLFQKAEGTLRNLYGGYQYSRNLMRRFGVGGTTSSISAGIGVATGAVLGGSIRLMMKGARVLLRDKEAYEKEMSFYALLLELGDYLIGGIYTNDFISDLTANGQKGNQTAQYLLGTAYSEGRGIDVNLENAVKWYDLAAENGEQRSRSILAYEYLFSETEYSLERKRKGITYLKERADSGDDFATSDLIELYWKGNVQGVPQDLKLAVHLAEEYSQKGNLLAKGILAQAYDTSPEYCIEDLMSFKNDLKAAEVNNQLLNASDSEAILFAAKNLSRMFFENRGGEIPSKTIIRCMTLLGDAGDLNAKMQLAKWYTDGCNVEKNYTLAQRLCNELLKSGNNDALAVYYYCNFKITDDKEEYKKSIEFATKYLELGSGDPKFKKELQTYIDEMDEKVSQMTDEERRVFFKEKKTVFRGKKQKTTEERKNENGKNRTNRTKLLIGGIILLIPLLFLIFFNKGDTESNHDVVASFDSGSNTSQTEKYKEFLEYEVIPKYGLASIGDLSYESEGCMGLVAGKVIDTDADQSSELITLISETKSDPRFRIELYKIDNNNIAFSGESVELGRLLEDESMSSQDLYNEFSGASAEYYLKSVDGKSYIIEQCTGVHSGGSVYFESMTIYYVSEDGIEQVCKVSSRCERGMLFGSVNNIEYDENFEDICSEELRRFNLDNKMYVSDSEQMYSGMIRFNGPDTNSEEFLLAKRERQWLGEYQSQVFDYTGIREVLSSSNSSEKNAIGSTIPFGEYNGKVIEWVVLDQQKNEMLLFAKYNFIEEKAYQEDGDVVSWEECNLRNWLNTTFFDKAFSEEEKEKIIAREVKNYDETNGIQSDTIDNVYILSNSDYYQYEEILNEYAATYEVEYFEEPYSRMGIGTQIWLRHMLHDGETIWVDFINHYGEPDCRAISPDSEMNVRPVIWIKND